MKVIRSTLYHNLANLLSAGVPILKSLSAAASGIKGDLPKVFLTLNNTISAGGTLAEAMAEYPKSFPALDIMVIEAGETSGKLPESLETLSQWYSFLTRIKRLATSRMMLPVMIIHIAAVVAPVPLLVFSDFDIVLYIKQMVSILAWLYVPVAIIFAVLRLTPRTGPLRRLLDDLTLRIPLLGLGLRYLAMSRYCRAFHMLYNAGIPITRCARQAVELTGNCVIADMFEGGYRSCSAGNPISEGFSDKLPADFLHIWQTAEQAGKLDEATKRLAERTGETAEFVLDNFSQWLPRLVYFLVCILLVILIMRNLGLVMGMVNN